MSEHVSLRLHQLEEALERIHQYAALASRKLAAQLRKHNAGEAATPWDAEDVGRILCHISTEAEQALRRRPAEPTPTANGGAPCGG